MGVHGVIQPRPTAAEGVTDKISFATLGRARRRMRRRFPEAAKAGLEDALLICAAARGVPLVQGRLERRESKRAELQRLQTQAGRRLKSAHDPWLDELEARLAEELRLCAAGVLYEIQNYREVVTQAATDLMAFVQDRLRAELASGDDPKEILSLVRQHELWFTQHHAIEAMRELAPGQARAEAKRIQLRVSGDEPLAICYGEPKIHGVYGPGLRWGCGEIFNDSLAVSGRMFALFCPGCNGNRRKPKLEAAAMARRAAK